jgi:hypothetical protein
MFIEVGMSDGEQCLYSINKKKNKKRWLSLRWFKRNYVNLVILDGL